MRLSTDRMYERVLASDPTCNGAFFTGVLTTGIYCLPSCRARKPRRENVRFFPTCAAARAAGLRPCRKCHPDDFAAGADPVLAAIEALVAEIRGDPAAFPDVRAMVKRSGFGPTRLFELFRLHYHTSPGEILVQARLARARQLLLETDRPLLEIAANAGFEAASAFHERFRATTGLTPGAYRALRTANRFTVALPTGYPLGYLRRALGRDRQSLTERLEGDRFITALRLSTGPSILRAELHETEISVELADGSATEAHALFVGMLGLEQDAAGFARLARKLGFARLVTGRPELRVSQTPSVYDGLVWSIVGQQINFAFACVLKRRLVERASTPLAEGLYAPLEPAAVAALLTADLAPLQFSASKARYLIETSRLVAQGALNLEALRHGSATRAERTLLDVRGLGPWSVNYLMMRSLGFADCVPLGDTGVTSSLQSLLRLEERPDVDATRRLMGVFSPYRSLATAHLWQFGHPIPS